MNPLNKDNLIAAYQQRLHLQNATFSLIEHEDAMVAIVYKVIQSNGEEFILKISQRTNDYLREVYFLSHFAGKLPVPRIKQLAPTELDVHGAILMEYLPGSLLNKADFNDELSFEIGTLLACIHLNCTAGYGDLIQQNDLSLDPRDYFTFKFEEGLNECSHHLSKMLLEQSRHYYDTHLHLLTSVDGPCIVHRDFRPGNLIIHDGRIRGIIDWAGARASFAQEDFCSLEHGEWPYDKKPFLAGYTSIRPIPDYKHLMPLLRLNKAIATIGFTVKNGTWNDKHNRIYQFNRHFLETFFNHT